MCLLAQEYELHIVPVTSIARIEALQKLLFSVFFFEAIPGTTEYWQSRTKNILSLKIYFLVQ